MVATKVGVLALQGDSREHHEALKLIGVASIDVKRPDQLDDIDALIIPGGESTAISKLMAFAGMFDAIGRRCADDSLSVLGTCAGMIVCAQTILDGRPDQQSLKIFDATVRRNALGRQKFSFEADVQVKGLDEPFPMVFIRGPGVEQTGQDVEVLAEWQGNPALCAQGSHLFATFHPELTTDGRIHRLFLDRLNLK